MSIELPSADQIKNISSEFVTGVTNVTKIDREGGDSVVFKVHSETKDYIFRLGGARENYDVEHAILKLAKQKNVKVPSVVGENIDLKKIPFTFSIEEKMPGIGLEYLPLSVWPDIFEEVGMEIAKLYKIKMRGFGVINTEHYRKTGELIGESSTWKDAVQTYCFDDFEEVINKVKKEKTENFVHSNLSDEQRIKLLQIYDNFDLILLRFSDLKNFQETASLLHGDLHRQHFIVENNHLTGLIDFNKTIVGDPLFDIAYASVMPHGDLCKHMLKTSKIEMDQERFGLYRLLIAAKKIHTRYIKFNYLHEYPEILDTVLEELKKFE